MNAKHELHGRGVFSLVVCRLFFSTRCGWTLKPARNPTADAKTWSKTLKLPLKPGPWGSPRKLRKTARFLEVFKWHLAAPGSGPFCNFCPTTDANTPSRMLKPTLKPARNAATTLKPSRTLKLTLKLVEKTLKLTLKPGPWAPPLQVAKNGPFRRGF